MRKKDKKRKELMDILEEEFVIYQLDRVVVNPGEKKFVPSKVCSPFFGTKVSDKTVFHDNAGDIDVDYGYDYIRNKEDKHISEEELIKRHGSKYYEFDILDVSNVEELKGTATEELQKNTNEEDSISSGSSFIESVDDVLNDLNKTVNIDFMDSNTEFDVRIGVEHDDTYEYNTYSESMPKPKQVNIPSFLADDNQGELKEIVFENIDIKEDVNINTNPEPKAPVYFSSETVNKPAVESKPAEPVKPVVQASTNKFDRYANYEIPYKELYSLSKHAFEETPRWLEEKKDIINQTLKDFAIDGEVINYTKGPAFTLYEIMLAPGVNVKKVNQIYDNLQMNLKAKSIRVLSPIPGKNTIGIEAPNDVTEMVKFGDILSEEYINDGKPLNLVLGKNIDGTPVYQDIADMPHALIAGATQSGKSVCINTILLSLLIKNSPDNLKLILVDPKKVELSNYNDLPHLATPVITDAAEATEALKWACVEMDRRYDMLARSRTKKASDYNKKRKIDPTLEPMPYLIIIVDEFNDLIMQCGQEANDCIIRLAQKARACGIHIILATQRPTVDVVSGTIKANVPCRIAFRVASSTDSSTILDETGAESLLGRGDMLIKNNGDPLRAQGAYMPDEEIEATCDFIRENYSGTFMFTHEELRRRINEAKGATTIQGKAGSNESDELLYAVAMYCIENNACSINSIQNQFNLGFNRASRIVTLLEEKRIVSPKNGTRFRDILVDAYELEKILGDDPNV